MELLIPHPSVFSRFWLYHLDLGPEAGQFLRQIHAGTFELVAPDTIEMHVLETLVLDLESTPAPLAPEIGAALLRDVQGLHRRLVRERKLRFVHHRFLHPAAFELAVSSRLSFRDALYVSCAIANHARLAVADSNIRRALLSAEGQPPVVEIFDIGEIQIP